MIYSTLGRLTQQSNVTTNSLTKESTLLIQSSGSQWVPKVVQLSCCYVILEYLCHSNQVSQLIHRFFTLLSATSGDHDLPVLGMTICVGWLLRWLQSSPVLEFHSFLTQSSTLHLEVTSWLMFGLFSLLVVMSKDAIVSTHVSFQ